MFRKALPLCLGLAMLVPVAIAAQDPAVVAPNVYKQAFDNERVRTFVVTIKPGEEIALHGHPDHLIYVTAGGKVRFTDEDGKSVDLELKTGETSFSPAGSHTAKNLGKKTIQGYMVELKEAAPAATLSAASAPRFSTSTTAAATSSRPSSRARRKSSGRRSRRPSAGRWRRSSSTWRWSRTLLNGFIQQTLAAPADPNWAMTESSRSIDTILRGGTDRTKKFTSPEFADPKGGRRAPSCSRAGAARGRRTPSSCAARRRRSRSTRRTCRTAAR